MSLSRRFFMKSGTLSALAAVFVNQAATLVLGQSTSKPMNYSIPQSVQGEMLYYSSYDTFHSYLGSIFSARGAWGEVVELTLTAVSRYVPNSTTKISTAKSPATDSCSLIFSATGKLPEFSSIPDLYHPALGKLSMFLVYKGEGDNGHMYEAVINHIATVPLGNGPVPRTKKRYSTLAPADEGIEEKAPATPAEKVPTQPGLRKPRLHLE